MNALTVFVNGRTLVAKLESDGTVVAICEEGRADARYSIAQAVVALAERRGLGGVINSTVQESIKALVDKHAAQ
ncbi:hypothetical protein [Trinickia mobilis]|uniref:hypothetical protein n=1 Tax=Trinickia mobilis TaxID=2816356 RepID=UPI001A900037|nr:hypothetical protein [Trinickia mobilis]